MNANKGEEMTVRPDVSVIVAVYNAESYIRRCLDSIVNQTFSNWECLLIDDGSTDGSGTICDEYARRDARFRVIHKQNGGVGSARKCGIDNACGVYTIHVDSDDWVEPDMLSSLHSYAAETEADMVICDYYVNFRTRQNYLSQKPSMLDSETVLRDLCKTLWGGPFNKFVKLECYRIYGVNYQCDLKCGEDTIAFIRLLSNKIAVSYLPKAFYHYDKSANGNSLTNAMTKERYFNQEKSLWEMMKYVGERNMDAIVGSRYQNCAYLSLKLHIYGKEEYRNKFYLLNTADILGNDSHTMHENLVVWCSFKFSYRIAVMAAKMIDRYLSFKSRLVR